MSGPIVALFGIFSFLGLVFGLAVWAYKRSNPLSPTDAAMAELARGLSVTPFGDQLSKSAFGRTFDARLVVSGKKNSPPAFHVTTVVDEETRDPGDAVGAYREDPRPRVVGRPTILLRKETGVDRLGKQLGINREVQTGDDAFDAGVYLETEGADDDVKKVLADERVRRATVELLDLGYDRLIINHEGPTLAAVQARASAQVMSAEVFDKTTALLSTIAGALPRFEGVATSPSRTSVVAASLLVPVAVFTVALIGAAFCENAWRPIGNGAERAGLFFGFLAWMPVMALIGYLLRGHSDSFRNWLFSFFFLLGGLPIGGIDVVVALNGKLDTSPLTQHPTEVTRLWITTGKNSRTCHVAVRSWSNAHPTVESTLSCTVQARLRTGNPVVVTTGAGYLGWEWIASFRPVNVTG
jgi:hypothetical protein